MSLHLTGDESADTLLTENPFALLVGMLLDQQIPMETAFAGPAKLRDRLGTVDPAMIAGYDPDAFLEAFRISPAVHRFPGSMAARVQSLAAAVRDEWGGDAAAIWTSAGSDGSSQDGSSPDGAGERILAQVDRGDPGTALEQPQHDLPAHAVTAARDDENLVPDVHIQPLRPSEPDAVARFHSRSGG